MALPSLDDIGSGNIEAPAPTSENADLGALEQRYGIPAGLYQRLLEKGEQSTDDAVSPKGAIGRAQLMPDTAKALGVDPHDPAQNVEGGARYLSQMYKQFGDWRLAVAAYNAGPGSVAKAGGVPDYPETRDYVRRVYGELPQLSDIATPVITPESAGVSQTFVGPDGIVKMGDTRVPVTAGQNKTIHVLSAGGMIDPTAPVGARNNPWLMRDPGDTYERGAYYIDPLGAVRQQPGAAVPGPLAQVGSGLGESGVDLAASAARLLPGSTDSTVRNMARSNQLLWEAGHEGQGFAQGARALGNFLLPAVATGAAGEGLSLAGRAAPAIAPVTQFATGAATRFGANPLLWGLSKATEGALAGGTAAALSSGASDEANGRGVASQIGEGALLGAPLNLLMPGAAAAAKGIGSVGRGVLEPFTAGGREAIVSRFLAKQAEGGPTKLDLTEYVPGSRPTLAQATGNPKLAMVEQGVRTLNPSPFDALAKGNQQARELAVDAARGDKQSLDDLIAARAQHTDPLREAAFAHTTPVDPTPVVAAIDTVLASPSGQRDAVVSALTNLRGKLVNPDGSMQTDPEQLWGVRQAIGDMLSPLAAGTKADGRLASRELMSVRDALDPVIEAGAPGFDAYRQAYADASRKIGAQEYLQKQNLTTSDGTISLGKVDTVIRRIEADRMKPGAHPAKDIADDHLGALYNLRSDLQRQAQGFVGRGTGSNTVEKMASNKLLDALAIPSALGVSIAHPVAGPAVALGKMALAAQNKKVSEALTNRLLNPEPLTLSGVNTAPAQRRLLGRLAGRAVLPAGTEVGRNALFAR